jgi:hypothetical protein
MVLVNLLCFKKGADKPEQLANLGSIQPIRYYIWPGLLEEGPEFFDSTKAPRDAEIAGI